eukprot:c17146_g1_i2.p1 GENE.c17146_g1_i2~~c17146_g1_i2.p1  ORF type:complete len:389 (+),score=84.26 c17146_g1_i2:271-1437(+)
MAWTVRRWFQDVFFKFFLAGIVPVRFPDFWLADQFTSVAVAFSDIEFLICHFILKFSHDDEERCVSHLRWTRPTMVAFPFTVRFLQCLRKYASAPQTNVQLWNAMKYFIGILITIFAALDNAGFAAARPFWIISAFCGFVYSFVWDVYRDWGFFAVPRSDPSWPLRPPERLKLAPNNRYVYFAAIAINFVLRLSWISAISQAAKFVAHPTLYNTCMSALEVARRIMWNFFRLEYEHTHNSENYRINLHVPDADAFVRINQQLQDHHKNSENDGEMEIMPPRSHSMSETSPTHSTLVRRHSGPVLVIASDALLPPPPPPPQSNESLSKSTFDEARSSPHDSAQLMSPVPEEASSHSESMEQPENPEFQMLGHDIGEGQCDQELLQVSYS